jgi:hypothetical protein
MMEAELRKIIDPQAVNAQAFADQKAKIERFGGVEALIKRGDPYAAALGAVLELAGEKPQAVQITVDEALDEAWQEPAAFDGCSSKGQSKPGAAQPIHIVRKTSNQPGVQA